MNRSFIGLFVYTSLCMRLFKFLFMRQLSFLGHFSCVLQRSMGYKNAYLSVSFHVGLFWYFHNFLSASVSARIRVIDEIWVSVQMCMWLGLVTRSHVYVYVYENELHTCIMHIHTYSYTHTHMHLISYTHTHIHGTSYTHILIHTYTHTHMHSTQTHL